MSQQLALANSAKDDCAMRELHSLEDLYQTIQPASTARPNTCCAARQTRPRSSRRRPLSARAPDCCVHKRKTMSYNRDWDAFNRDVIVEFRANAGQVAGRKHPLILLTTI